MDAAQVELALGYKDKTKTCSHCQTTKTLADFGLDASMKSGFSTYCRACRAQANRLAYHKKRTANMTELVHAKQLAEDFGIAEPLALGYIAAAKLQAHKLLVGKDMVNLFDKLAATKAVGERVNEEKQIQAANLARLETAKIPTLKDVMAQLKTLTGEMSDAADLTCIVKKLAEQNVCMFKVLTDMKSEMQARLIELQTSVRNASQSEARTVPTMPSREPLPSVSPLKVGIVGLHAGDHAVLKKEFGELFRLSILTPDESRKISGLKNMDKTYLMSKYAGNRHMDLLKAINQSPSIVPGTVNELKEVLTALYLNH